MGNVLAISLLDNKKIGWSVIDNEVFDLLARGEINIEREKEETIYEYSEYIYDVIDNLVQSNIAPLIILGIEEGNKFDLVKSVIGLLVKTTKLKLVEVDLNDVLEKLDIRLAKGDIAKQCVEWVNDKYNTDIIYVRKTSKNNEDIIAKSIMVGSYYIGNFEEKIKFGRRR